MYPVFKISEAVKEDMLHLVVIAREVRSLEKVWFQKLSVSQVCDKKHSILFTETECLFLAPGFRVVVENQILLRTPRKDNVYCLDMKNVS